MGCRTAISAHFHIGLARVVRLTFNHPPLQQSSSFPPRVILSTTHPKTSLPARLLRAGDDRPFPPPNSPFHSTPLHQALHSQSPPSLKHPDWANMANGLARPWARQAPVGLGQEPGAGGRKWYGGWGRGWSRSVAISGPAAVEDRFSSLSPGRRRRQLSIPGRVCRSCVPAVKSARPGPAAIVPA